MHRQEKIALVLRDHIRVLESAFQRQSDEMVGFAERVVEAFHRGRRLYVLGSGPMAAVANLVASLFLHRLNLERPSLPAMSLCADETLALYLARDGQSQHYFSKQLRSLAGEGDIVLAFADAGTDNLIQEALKVSGQLGCTSAIVSREKAEFFKEPVDFSFRLETESGARMLEGCLFFGDLLCELVEGELFGI